MRHPPDCFGVGDLLLGPTSLMAIAVRRAKAYTAEIRRAS
jgi:hypothetical protein